MYALYYEIETPEEFGCSRTSGAVIGVTKEAAFYVMDEELDFQRRQPWNPLGAKIAYASGAEFDDEDAAIAFLASEWCGITEEAALEALKDEDTRRKFFRKVDFAF